MRAGISKSLIFAVISVLVVALVYSTLSTFYVTTFVASAVPPEPGWGEKGECENIGASDDFLEQLIRCCWTETDPDDPEGIEIHKCQTCTADGFCEDWVPEQVRTQEQPPSPPEGPRGPLGSIPEGGVLPELEQPPLSPEVAPPTVPEADKEGTPRIIGESPSPTGYCSPIRTPTCIPCDPGLPGADCIPQTEWPPTRTTETGTPEEAAPLVPPIRGPLGETASQIAPPTAEDGTEQPPTETLCIVGFELDEDTNLCVPTESQVTEQPQEAAEESEEQQQTDEQSSEESDSGDDNNN